MASRLKLDPTPKQTKAIGIATALCLFRAVGLWHIQCLIYVRHKACEDLQLQRPTYAQYDNIRYMSLGWTYLLVNLLAISYRVDEVHRGTTIIAEIFCNMVTSMALHISVTVKDPFFQIGNRILPKTGTLGESKTWSIISLRSLLKQMRVKYEWSLL